MQISFEGIESDERAKDNIKIVKRFFQIKIQDLAFVKFIIESYEGIAMVRTLNARRGEIEIMVPACNTEELDELLLDLMRTVFLKEIKKPFDYFDLVL